MAEPLHKLDDALEALEKMAMHTSAGAYVKLEDVKKLMQERAASHDLEEQVEPKPKNMNQAKQMILRDKDLMSNFPPKTPSAGRSVPAAEPQPPSRA